MAQSDMQRGTLKSEELFFDSEASLLDQQDFDMPSCPYNDVFNSKDSHMEQITFLKNVQVLLEAAQFLESAERKDGSEFFLYIYIIYIYMLRLILCRLPQNSRKTRHSLSIVSDNKGPS